MGFKSPFFKCQQYDRLIDGYFTVEFILDQSLMVTQCQSQRLFTSLGKFPIHKNKHEKHVDINSISYMIRSVVDIDNISISGNKHAKRTCAR
jgi:hypothetical protein